MIPFRDSEGSLLPHRLGGGTLNSLILPEPCGGFAESPLIPPTAISSPEPRLPSVTSTPSRIFLSLIVDTKGHPQNVKVVDNSGEKSRNRAAIETARAWRFKPATCDGEPVPSLLKLELDFRFVH